MKINMIKSPGGNLFPAHDRDAEKLIRFKSGEHYEIEIKLGRNYKFHKKVFAFFNFCFEHWGGDNEFQDEAKQFDVFRANLTVLAGYYDSFYSIKGERRIEAKSLSYSSMSQEEFERLYIALTNAALKNIFKTADELTYNKLIGFF